MKAIILAAGQGSRLRPHTNDRPKSMVELAGKALILHQIEAMQAAGIACEDIAIVTGYKKKHLERLGITTFVNPKYMTTNMVYSLFCAEDWMADDEDLVITYGDIAYAPTVMQTLLNTKGDIVLTADLEWQKLWSARSEDFILDAETFQISSAGLVSELGKRPKSLADIEAQYMGLIKVAAAKIRDFKEAFATRNAAARADNIYMTDFLNDLICEGWSVCPALITGDWLELDTVSDLDLYASLLDSQKPGDLTPLFSAFSQKPIPC